MPMPSRKNEAIWIESCKRWQIKVQRDGERRSFYSSTPGKKGKIEAEGKADKWIRQGTETDPRFNEAMKAFLDEKKTTTGTANYKKLESIMRIWIDPVIKRKRLSKITFQDWQNCINNAGKAGKSKRTCGNIRATISSFAQYCRKNRWALEQPEFLTLPTNAPVGKRNILQPSDLKTLFTVDTITHYGRLQKVFYIHAWRFMVLLGLRRGELAGLQKTDLENGVLHVQRSINSLGEITRGKTENASRYILLPQAAKDVLEAQNKMLKERCIVSCWLFPDEDGGPMDTNKLYDRWRTYASQHGINTSLHELRHTFISVVKADLPEQLLKPMVGHSVNMDSYAVYGHEVDGDRKRTAEIVDNVFRNII